MTYTTFGLILDIVGVLLLGYSVAFSRDAVLVARSETCWDFSGAVLEALVQERASMRVGVTALFTGFVFQLLGALDCPEPEKNYWFVIWGITFILAVSGFIYLYKGAAREYQRVYEKATPKGRT